MSSIYLPEALKERLVQAARRKGFVVRRGSQSQLSEYIAHLLDLDEQSPRVPPLERVKTLLDGFDFSKFDDEHVQKLLHERRMNL
ncbi:MAG: hypothetical protein WC314_11155 [Vulcanimicrobiota bacterium]